MKPLRAIGLMTGTVLDGNIDIAMLETDGEQVSASGAYRLMRYDDRVLPRLQEALELAQSWRFAGPEPAEFAEVERLLTIAQADAVQQFLSDIAIDPATIDVVGFHGQTLLHAPPGSPMCDALPVSQAAGDTGRARGYTRQLGDGQLMADRLGMAVVCDFRQADMAAGGQGAPLAPVYHAALMRGAGLGGGHVVLNLGGVGNLTWWSGESDLRQPDALIAFDTGPANAPINDLVRCRTGEPMDTDGHYAAAGRYDPTMLEALLADTYFLRCYPKSLDRNAFDVSITGQLSLPDGAALLTAFSAAAVARGLDWLPTTPVSLIVCGGGRHNPALVAAIRRHTGVPVQLAEEVGWRGDALEAECFAYLAVRSRYGMALSFPSTTGVGQPVCGGRICYPEKRSAP